MAEEKRVYVNRGGILRLGDGRRVQKGERFHAHPSEVPKGASDLIHDVTPEQKPAKKSGSKKSGSGRRRSSKSTKSEEPAQGSEEASGEGEEDGGEGEEGEFSL
jgi:hypothetical protein